MHGDKLDVQVQDLEQKIIQLLEQHRNQQATLLRLQEENQQLIQRMANQEKSVHDVSDQLNAGALVRAGGATQDWGTRIDNYISDIDQSIAYLERLQ
jgi:Ni,Fe-hydrogenase III large subunit